MRRPHHRPHHRQNHRPHRRQHRRYPDGRARAVPTCIGRGPPGAPPRRHSIPSARCLVSLRTPPVAANPEIQVRSRRTTFPRRPRRPGCAFRPFSCVSSPWGHASPEPPPVPCLPRPGPPFGDPPHLLPEHPVQRSCASRQLKEAASPPPPAPPATARPTAPPLRPWRSCPGARGCHRGSPSPGRACRGGACRGPLPSSPSCCCPRAASAFPPAPAAGPPCSSAAPPSRSPLRRLRLPLRRPRDPQRRLLGRGKAAQAHFLAAATHPRLVGLGGLVSQVDDAEVARAVVCHEQRQPFRQRLLQGLLARQRRRRRSPLLGPCVG
eukprot:scaffold48651_cov57-Phaeocystis_antarctica.AAC.5